jgi:serine protease Do
MKALFISLLLIVMLSVSAGCGYVEIVTPTPTPSPTLPAPSSAPTSPLNPGWNSPSANVSAVTLPSIADVVAEVKPSVVAITTEVVTTGFFNQPITREGAGSGWIIDPDGIIVTNNHVVSGANSITATLDDGSSYSADMDTVYTDPLNDLAIFHIDAPGPVPAARVGDSTKMRVGDWVVAIGNPLGLGISATEGIISQIDVSVPVEQGQVLYDLIKTSAAINPGNSGGPLVNMAGEVIGITSAKFSAVEVEGIGYAISSNTALPIIEELVRNGYVVRPWLGVGLYPVNDMVVQRFNLGVDEGVLLLQVAAGSPADIAGLAQGDVIVEFKGEKTTSIEELTEILHSSEIGETISVAFYRGDQRMTTEVTVAESPPPQS